MLLLKQSGCIATVALEVNEVAQFLTELSVCDYYFTTRTPSLTGLGAILTAFGRFDEAILPMHVRCKFINLVRSMDFIDPSSDEVQQCKNRLSATYLHNTGYQKQQYENQALDEGGCFSSDCVPDVGSLEHSTKRHCGRSAGTDKEG